MNLRHFENKARQSWWLVHIEAWRQSGLDRTNYCRQNGLWKCTFDRWLKYLAGKEAARKHTEYQAELRRQKKLEMREQRRKRRARLRFGVSTDERNRALQAFWAMHVEAMNWSGMGVREYAAVLHLSPTSLRKWRDRLDENEVEIDWRAHLHPSARPVVSTITNGGSPGNSLTSDREIVPTAPARQARRFFTDEQKHAIARESDQSGVRGWAVARKLGIATGILFRWRTEFGVTQKKRARLAFVTLPDDTPAMRALQKLVRAPDGMMAVDLPDGRRLFVPEGSNADAAPAQAEGGGTER
jgi:transposase-like protein